MEFIAKGKTSDGKPVKYHGTGSGKKDPGYGDTSAMISEIAMFLAKNRDKCAKGGVLTPGAALGTSLYPHLANANIKFAVKN